MNPLRVLNKATGEILELAVNTEDELAEAYAYLNEQIKAYERAKVKIRDLVLARLEDLPDGIMEVNRYRFKTVIRNYRNYDRGTLRAVVQDEELYEYLTKPDKPTIDSFIKDVVAGKRDDLSPEAVARLRESMVDERVPSVSLMLEKK